MKRLRLTKMMREHLKHRVGEIVSPVAEKAALEEAYEAAAPLVRSMVEEKFPPRDMKVCAKYDAAHVDDCIKTKLPDGDVKTFFFKSKSGPLVTSMTYHGQIYLADDTTAAAIEEWHAAGAAFKAVREQRIAAYKALIDGSSFMDQVADIWPEAANVVSIINLPIALNPDQIAIVRSDVQERVAA